MALPKFLIIGAMKSATTTLYRDLILNPKLFPPADKEPENLAKADILTPEGLARYQEIFKGMPANRITFDASNVYSQMHRYPNVPQHAMKVLGPDIQLVYLLRDPLRRTVSQHNHDYLKGLCDADINVAIHAFPDLINCSLYATQLKPWIDCYGREKILVLVSETYTRNRRKTIEELSLFLGIEPCVEGLVEDKVFNKSDGKPVLGTGWKRITGSGLYRSCVRPIVPFRAREWIRQHFVKKARPKLVPPTEKTLDFIIKALEPDLAELVKIPGCAGMTWDLQKSKQALLSPAQGASENASL